MLRADLNEPIWDGGSLRSTKRVDASISTIYELLARKNKVVIMSHHSEDGQSMAPVARYLQKTFPNLQFVQSSDINTAVGFVKSNPDAELVMIENTRLFENGADEKNDDALARQLASMGEYFLSSPVRHQGYF